MKRMCTNYQITAVGHDGDHESRSDSGQAPGHAEPQGSSAIPYDINANWTGYNDLADLMDQSQIYWGITDMTNRSLVRMGKQVGVPTKKPIVEIVGDKNKISGFKGTTFFEMKPESGFIRECSMEDQGRFRSKVLAQMKKRRQARAVDSKKRGIVDGLPTCSREFIASISLALTAFSIKHWTTLKSPRAICPGRRRSDYQGSCPVVNSLNMGSVFDPALVLV